MNPKRWTIRKGKDCIFGLGPNESKYKAKPTTIDGIRFASKAESRAYMVLKDMKGKGEVKYFLRQVPMHCAANIRYVVDFMIVHNDNRIEYVDVKGFRTKEFELKKRLVEATYPVEITLWK